MTLAEALEEARHSGLDRLDAQILLLHSLGRDRNDRAWLVAHDGDDMPVAAHSEFMQLCRRRSEGDPVAYIVGRKEFFGLDLKVDRRVLVPRPETETLVEWALEIISGSGAGAQRVIDLGTGSGAIALAIARLQPRVHVEAVDTSTDALDLARENARRLDLHVEFRLGNWLEGSVGPYDLILSNPPYVAKDDPHLAALSHEPAIALVSGSDGLRDIRAIVSQAPACLRRGGSLLLEHGYEQAAAVRSLMVDAGLQEVSSRRDLAGIERCSGGKKP